MSSVLGAPTSSPGSALVRARVLVIDDEPGILNFVSRGLRAEGYTVDLEADGDTGLSAALGQPYDLVILDLLLPGASGIDLQRELVQQNPGQPVIVLSALTDTFSKVQSFELGAEDYLAKPFSIEELLARVRARLRDAWSRPTRRFLWIDVAWGIFALLNLVAIYVFAEWETVPFHFIWVSLTILYGFRVWQLRSTLILLGVIIVITGILLIIDIAKGAQPLDELTEVPLMSAMFLAMVWHARRRLVATEAMRRVSDENLRLLERERRFIQNAS